MGASSEEKEKARIARENAARFQRLADMAEGMTYDKETVLDNLRKASEISPEIAGLYEALQQDPTMMEQLETDPRFQDIMQGNLETIQEMAEESGFTEEDMAKRRELQRATAADAKARDKSIVREMMQRGQAGSGTELLARLGSSQAAAQRQAESSDRMAIESAAARRAALQQASQQASAMQQNQFAQGADKARAADARNLNNLLRRQAAQDRNLGLKQGLANLTAQQRSNYYQQAAQVEQQDYANKMAKLGAISGAQNMAGQYAMQGVAPKTNWGAIGGGVVGAVAGGYATGWNPAGITAGYQAGSAAGGAAYEEGGIKRKALGKMSEYVGNMPKQEEPSAPSAAEEIAAFNSLQRQHNYNQGGVKQEQQAPKQSGMSNEDLGALLGAMAKSMRPEREGRRYSIGGYSEEEDLYELGDLPKEYGGRESSVREQKVIKPKSDSFYADEGSVPELGYREKFNKLNPNLTEEQGDAKFDKMIHGEKEEDNSGTLAALKAISKGVADATKRTPLRKIENTLESPKVTSYDIANQQKLDFNIGGGITAKDGAVKLSPEDMRDMLMSEVNAFACGGVKKGKNYAEGGAASLDDLKRMDDNLDVADLREEVGTELGVPEMEAPETEGDDFSYESRREFEDNLRAEEKRDAAVAERNEYAEGGITPELVEATQMLRTNKPAPASPMPGGQPPMPAPPMDQNMMPPQAPQMPPQGVPMDPAMLPPQGAPMPPQGQMMADGGMAYEDGGEGTIIPGENYEGDELPDRINSGEMVLNVEQQDRLNDQLMELKRLKSKERTDKMLADGTAEVNPMQQESLMAFVRGEIEVDDLPNDRIVKEPTVGEPSGGMAELLGMLTKKRRG